MNDFRGALVEVHSIHAPPSLTVQSTSASLLKSGPASAGNVEYAPCNRNRRLNPPASSGV